MRHNMLTGLGSETVRDFTAEIFDVDRIQLAQDKALWCQSGNTQTVPFSVSLSTVASWHGKRTSVATNKN